MHMRPTHHFKVHQYGTLACGPYILSCLSCSLDAGLINAGPNIEQ